jgi:bifunctional N-acetylglucosamine-1-phosphate-uridyltransferase/glucosamine-1-phosphate-acetyltransferase GlmU-like protein
VVLADPSGYGRVVRGDAAGRSAHEGGRVRGIVEDKDASATERAIRELASPGSGGTRPAAAAAR